MNGTMKLRRALPADAAAVRELTREAYSKWVPVIGREPLPMRADYDRAVRDHIVVLCEDGARLAALVELIAANDHLLIENLAVRPGDQGKGLGALLLAHADVVARSLNLPEIRLFTNAPSRRTSASTPAVASANTAVARWCREVSPCSCGR